MAPISTSSDLFRACVAALEEALKPHISGTETRASINGKSAKVSVQMTDGRFLFVLAVTPISTQAESGFFGLEEASTPTSSPSPSKSTAETPSEPSGS